MNPSPPIVQGVWDKDCEPLNKHCSSEWLVIPEEPIMFGIFQFVYLTNRSISDFKINALPDFLCFKQEFCPILLLEVTIIEIIPDLICFNTSSLKYIHEMDTFMKITVYFKNFVSKCHTTGIEKSCKNSSYFHCNESLRCIPYHRVGDGVRDCFFDEDELYDACQFNDSNRFECKYARRKCLAPTTVGNGHNDCSSNEDEIFVYATDLISLIPFMHLCNSVRHYGPPLLLLNETDETNCEWWPCNNSYTHCNTIWDCANAIDELNCPNTICSFNELECKNRYLDLPVCLPIANMFDQYIDDCQNPMYQRRVYLNNDTNDLSENYYSWNNSKCVSAKDICKDYHLQAFIEEDELCLREPDLPRYIHMNSIFLVKNDEYLCSLGLNANENGLLYVLTTKRFGNLPKLSTINTSTLSITKTNDNEKTIANFNVSLLEHCHQGILVLMSGNETKKCLCPPSYFGEQCQWQNQRISLTLQFLSQIKTDFMPIFQIVIMLIDEQEQVVTNHEQLTYMPIRDCNTKYNIYLLYPNRPKNLSVHYSIRIDAFHKITLTYWMSWYLSIPYSFLPVNRIASQLRIRDIENLEPCPLSCGKYGRCMTYANNKYLYFCQCKQGYSGRLCNIKHSCSCSDDSFCFSSSVCICPLYKFGPKCYLKYSICQSGKNPCKNNGICIPSDDRISLQTFTCVCQEGYSGDRCENQNSHIIIYLDENIMSKTSSLLIHFITAFKDSKHEQTATFKKIPFDKNFITINVVQPFNIIFMQIPNQNYYLAVLRETFIPSENISTNILPDQRCLKIEELLNATYLNYEYLRRTKYYPFLCRKNSQLKCFYDENLMCICDLDRFSSCFRFNHAINRDFSEYKHCENNAQYFQNNQSCPTKWLCICEDCFYGSRCQFSTKGFILSLDSILSYHIKPNVKFTRQPLIVKISLLMNSIILILGIINGLFSIMTFSSKRLRQRGSGYYHLASSISSTIMIFILTIKFSQLVLSQMLVLTDRALLMTNCVSLDFILKTLLVSSEWFNALVAVERMISVIQKAGFNRRKSKRIAKWVIVILFICITLTHIHDPIHRQLIDDYDGDEKRTWCFARYSSAVNNYNLFLNLFHFFVPFSINLICTIHLIIKRAQSRFALQTTETFRENLQLAVLRQQYPLSAPLMLVLLSLPRLIISFITNCMRSPRESWLYLIGYYVSFIPSVSTFIVFVLPSQIYKREFNIQIQAIITKIRFNFIINRLRNVFDTIDD